MNGEDVELCLDVQQHLGKQVWLCTAATAIHEAETTRRQDPRQAGNSADQLRLRARTRHFLDHTTEEQLRVLLQQQQLEAQLLRDQVRNGLQEGFCNARQLQQRLQEQETVLLALREERLKLRDQLDKREGC